MRACVCVRVGWRGGDDAEVERVLLCAVDP